MICWTKICMRNITFIYKADDLSWITKTPVLRHKGKCIQTLTRHPKIKQKLETISKYEANYIYVLEWENQDLSFFFLEIWDEVLICCVEDWDQCILFSSQLQKLHHLQLVCVDQLLLFLQDFLRLKVRPF